jgi:lipoprotein-anchoring transpeptidase ErfK/SrfK
LGTLVAVTTVVGMLAIVVVSATGGGGAARAAHPSVRVPAAPTAPSTTTTTLPPGSTYIAQAVGAQVHVYSGPSVPTPAETLPNPWPLNDDPSLPVQQDFLIEAQQPGWVEVLLPERPNGKRGWIPASEVTVVSNEYHIEVSRFFHQITVYKGAQIAYQGPVAVGAPATPTPTGLYYLRVLLRSPDPNSAYGPYAYGLSAHSDALTTFDGGDAEIGLHGNDDASALGQSVSHGCVRMDNAAITQLSTILPLGTPITIS